MSKKQHLSSNFIIGLILIVVVPTLFISTILYSVLKEKAIESYTHSTFKNMEYTATVIESELKRLRLKTAVMISDDELHDYLNLWRYSDDKVFKGDYHQELNSHIGSRYDYQTEIDSAFIFFEEKGYYSYGGLNIVDEDIIRSKEWYKDIANKFEVRILQPLNYQLEKDNSQNQLTFVAGINKTYHDIYKSGTERYEVFVVNYKTDIFSMLYSDFKRTFEGELIIFDDYGNVIASSNQNLEDMTIEDFPDVEFLSKKDTQTENYMDKESDIMTSLYHTPNSHWLIVNRTNLGSITGDIDEQLKLFYRSFFSIVVLFILFSMMFFRKIISSIKRLMLKMKKAEDGIFDDAIQVNGYGEIQELENAYNQMIYKIDRLMIERDQKERERQTEEIKALQAQINPHFIYNTLNCIRIMAMISNKQNITNLTDAFMELLSGMFKDPEMIISIEREIEYAKNYVYIMNVRYGDTFKVEWDIDEKILSYGIPKLILQPIIENAIMHGVSQLEREGIIAIKGYELEDTIVFELIDNGCGMNEDQIKNLLTERSVQQKGLNKIGVNNVHRRIQLNYGEQYGLSIISEVNQFTNVMIKLAKVEM